MGREGDAMPRRSCGGRARDARPDLPQSRHRDVRPPGRRPSAGGVIGEGRRAARAAALDGPYTRAGTAVRAWPSARTREVRHEGQLAANPTTDVVRTDGARATSLPATAGAMSVRPL